MAGYFNKIYHTANNLNRRKVPILPRLLIKLNRILFSCDVPLNPDIDKTVTFGHNGLGVVTHQKVKIGKGTKILPQVTIGGNMGKRKEIDGEMRTAPVIGDNVLIGAGAKILGPVKIGDNSLIGAGSVVMIDVPNNGVAAGVPAKIVKKSNF
ncbi:serine O-acetyltransferase [Virgibacillus halodenitrificans]|uniref:Serine acetyltransferase n=1 Tax=Virgibacillus halodenitrificans TaxID=1482 RepID=A0ABR7VJ44_VIRHA|nr:DapH/DapD/GlmU-related protein [Virgibacillus halodenitrificans]MBD1221301.1 serine acetyltransferase [Virgibacillus halodenitrificans]